MTLDEVLQVLDFVLDLGLEKHLVEIQVAVILADVVKEVLLVFVPIKRVEVLLQNQSPHELTHQVSLVLLVTFKGGEILEQQMLLDLSHFEVGFFQQTFKDIDFFQLQQLLVMAGLEASLVNQVDHLIESQEDCLFEEEQHIFLEVFFLILYERPQGREEIPDDQVLHRQSVDVERLLDVGVGLFEALHLSQHLSSLDHLVIVFFNQSVRFVNLELFDEEAHQLVVAGNVEEFAHEFLREAMVFVHVIDQEQTWFGFNQELDDGQLCAFLLLGELLEKELLQDAMSLLSQNMQERMSRLSRIFRDFEVLLN